MTIRFACSGDISELIELGRRVKADTRFAPWPFDEQRVRRSLEHVLAPGQERYGALIAQSSSGAIVGGLLGVIERPMFTESLVANVMLFLVLPEHRMGGHAVQLLRAFEKWAKNRGVVEIVFGVNSGCDFERVGRFAQRMGYRKIGENYALRLNLMSMARSVRD
jgi:GNAT superfamily N-acetyltransferase